MVFKEPDGKPKPYESKHSNGTHKGTVDVTGSLTVDLGIGHGGFAAIACFADEPGDADDVARLSCANNDDGTFTITVKDLVLSEAAPNTVGWATSASAYSVSFIAIEEDAADQS